MLLTDGLPCCCCCLSLWGRGIGACVRAYPRRLGSYRNTVCRWAEGRALPNYQHRRALLELADTLGLTHMLID